MGNVFYLHVCRKICNISSRCERDEDLNVGHTNDTSKCQALCNNPHKIHLTSCLDERTEARMCRFRCSRRFKWNASISTHDEH